MRARWLLPVVVPPVAVCGARALGATLRVRTAGLEALEPLMGEPPPTGTSPTWISRVVRRS